jgi:putative flippase GtrA
MAALDTQPCCRGHESTGGQFQANRPFAVKSLFSPQIIKFSLVGLLNTTVSLAIIFGSKGLLGWSDLIANAAGYFVGMIISFVANRRWTFEHHGTVHTAAARFLIAFGISYGANLGTVFALIEVGVNSYLAHAAGMVPYTLIFYLVSRFFVFAEPSCNSASDLASRKPSRRDILGSKLAAALALLLLGTAVFRGGTILLSDPMLALANNYDMVRVHACLKAYPIRGPDAHPFSGSPDAPIARYQFRYEIAAPCFFTTEAVLARLARPLFKAESMRSADGSFTIRWGGLIKFALFIAIAVGLTIAWLRRRQVRSALANATIVAVVLVDPAVTLYLNGFYAEYGAVLFGYGTIAGAALLLGGPTPPRPWSLALLALATFAFVCTKVQHAGLGLTIALFMALPLLFRVRLDRRVLAAVAFGGLLGLTAQLIHLHQPANESMRLANLTSTILRTLLPLSDNPGRTAVNIGLPERCGLYAGYSWYLPPISGRVEDHPCPEVAQTSYFRLLGLAFVEPGLFARFVIGGLAHSRPWIPNSYDGMQYLGVVEGASRGTPLPEGWFSWSRLLDRLPLWAIYVIVILPTLTMAALLSLRRSTTPTGTAVLTALALAPYPVGIAVMFGNGYQDAAKQMHLLYVCVLSFWTLATITMLDRAWRACAQVAAAYSHPADVSPRHSPSAPFPGMPGKGALDPTMRSTK